MDNINEQWKSGGDCEICRRRSYCSTPCTAAKRRKQRAYSNLLTSVMLRAMTGQSAKVNDDK